MYRVIIADDEEIERKALRKKLIKNVNGIEVCALAEDGQELITAIKKYKPDIIIVDIEMPVLTGLEAIRTIREEKLMEHGKILVYTAYGQFSYAQEALQSKVDDYILKPATIKKLVDTMDKCISELESERQELEKYMQTEKMLGNVRTKVMEEFLTAVSMPDIDEEQEKLFRYVLGENFMNGYITAFSSKPTDASEENVQMENLRDTEKMLQKTIRESGGIPGNWMNHELYCYMPVNNREENQKFNSIKKVRDILEKTGLDIKIKLRAGIGNYADNHSGLHQSYLESFKALHFIKNKEQVVHIQDLNKESESNPFLANADNLVGKLRNHQLADCKNEIQLCFLQVRNNELHDVKENLMEAVMKFVSKVSEWIGQKEMEKYSLSVLCEQLMNQKDREALRIWYWDLLMNIEEDIHSFYAKSPNYWVQCAMDYISDHYWQDISLAIVADAIGVNSFYLSHIFSEVTGSNYSSYLSGYRIEKACKLLEKYDYSMNELAEKVGFNSVGYFSKVFKKKMGCSINEYKRNR